MIGWSAPVRGPFGPALRMMRRRSGSPGELVLMGALRPWERQLVLEGVRRWSIRGGIGALVVANLVLLVGWVTTQPEAELRPWAIELMIPVLLAGLFIGAWPARQVGRAAELDVRLGLGDRLATAWVFRNSDQSVVRLQRADAIARLGRHSPRADLKWHASRAELIALAVTAVLAAILLVVPSPQQAVLDRQAAEQVAIQQASQRLEALRLEATSLTSLTPEQARQLDELLRQAQAELNRTHSQQEATGVLTRAQDQLSQQMADPNADLRDEALAAMSETLSAEPRTQALATALQREDAQAASDAVKTLASQVDQLSDIERQALSRALQRAANVGRADPRTAAAMREAAQAVAARQPASAALTAADAALRDAIEASQAQAALNATLQRLRDLQTQLGSGRSLNPEGEPGSAPRGRLSSGRGFLGEATPVALDAGGSRQMAREPSVEAGRVGGIGGSLGLGAQGSAAPRGQAAENVFVPGRAGTGATDQDLVNQAFSVRGAPRPYREVLGEYAQTTREYVDRPDISPAVRDLVKRYFQDLQEGQ